MIKTFFFVGNKRSGTSLLVRLLNLHPNVFVTHESDIIWILYRFHNGQKIIRYEDDGFLGASYTIDNYGHLLSKQRTPYENYLLIQQELMKNGSDWLPPMTKKPLQWIGDKKPIQHVDPRLNEFIRSYFPDPKFIHIIRHPVDCLGSYKNFSEPKLSDLEWFEFWARNEKRVISAKNNTSILTIKYKDLCKAPKPCLGKIFDYLELDTAEDILNNAEPIKYSSYHSMNSMKLPKSTQEILEIYHYDL